MGTKKLADALTLANYAGLDLVLMSGNSDRAVGKIMDYNKYRYEKQKRQKEALKNQRANNKDMKEYQLSVTIDVGDFNTRKKNAESYLQMAHTDLGKEVLERFASELSESSVIETKPKLEGRTMTMILAPKK